MATVYFSRRKILIRAFQLFDLLSVSLCLFFSLFYFYHDFEISSLSHLTQIEIKIIYILFYVIAIFSCYLTFSSFKLYKSRRLTERSKEFIDALKAITIISFLIWFEGILLEIRFLTVQQMFLFWSCSVVFILGGRILMRYILKSLRLRGRNLRHVIVIGTNPRAIQFVEKIVSTPELGYRFVGFVDNQWIGIKNIERTKYVLICNLESFPDFIRRDVVDEVIVALPIKSFYDQAFKIVSSCEEQGILVRYLSSIFDIHLPNSRLDYFENYSLIQLSHKTIYGYPSIVKQTIDYLIALTLILFLIPFFLLIAVLIRLTSPGPAIYAQDRVGYGKRIFRMYKFRTMSENAEYLQKDLEIHNELCGPVFKIKNDPRITKVGKYLRKYSIDELPQLINVLKGDMSIVGPRPLPVRDYKGFDKDWHRRRFSVRPGITCLWQVQGRTNLPFEKWMELDMEYIDNWSLLLDLKILIKTIPSVLKGVGAA
jgi:exopolysaccharide biosynthesis polyprenyl glycosylphosphotransferase